MLDHHLVEFWLVLHFVDRLALVDRYKAQKVPWGVLGCRNKLDEDAQSVLLDRFAAAMDPSATSARTVSTMSPQSSTANADATSTTNAPPTCTMRAPCNDR
jgi:hypothetical protein